MRGMDTFRQRFDTLVEQIGRGSYAQEVAVFEALRFMTPEAAAYALNLLHSEAAQDRDYGCTVVHWLLRAVVDGEVAVPPELEGSAPVFIQLALGDPSSEVRASAGFVLSQFKIPEAIPILCGLVDGDELARDTAAGCLASFGLAEWQNPAYAAFRTQAEAALLRLTYDAELSIRCQAVCSLGHGGHDGEEVRRRLLDLLHSDDWGIHAYSARVLGEMGEERLIPILQVRLHDVEEMERSGWGYLDAVASLNDPRLLSTAERGLAIRRAIFRERGDLEPNYDPEPNYEWGLGRMRAQEVDGSDEK